jgi:D-alanine-D-alanine ligase
MSKLNVAVVFGGRSVEHEISIISAMQCISAIDKDKYQVIPIYISKKGVWYTGDELLKLENYKKLDLLLERAKKILICQNADAQEVFKLPPVTMFGKKVLAKVDVVFPVMHGTNGEDGALQGLLQLMNIPYVGCDLVASAISMDKVVSKMIFESLGISVLDCVSFYAHEWIKDKDAVTKALKEQIGYPLIVKPANLGSSIGVTAVKNADELENAVDLAVSMSHRIIVERQIVNLKEINCAVIGDREFQEVSVLEEPIRGENILSFKDKYLGGDKFGAGKMLGAKTSNPIASQGMTSLKRKIPADVSDEISNKIKEMAKLAFVNLNCSGVVRIDFLLDQDEGAVYLCEINSIPGSLSFYLWEPMGMSFTALIQRLIELALKRHRENSNLISSYDTNILALQGKA